MKLEYFYLELPKLVRIVSRKLCLDHTFAPSSTQTPATIEELCVMANSSIYDSIMILLPQNAEVTYHDNNCNEDIPVDGWVELKNFERAIPKS